MKPKVSNTMLNVLLAAMAAGILFMEHFNRSPKFLLGTFAAAMAIGLLATWRRKNFTARIIVTIIFFCACSFAIFGASRSNIGRRARGAAIKNFAQRHDAIALGSRRGCSQSQRLGAKNFGRTDSDLLPESGRILIDGANRLQNFGGRQLIRK